MSTARVFSGAQPTGELHIGNYLGAIRNWVTMMHEPGLECTYAIVDAHAITMPHDPKELRERTLRLAHDLMALGVDPKRCTLFIQSEVPEHTELAWYLAAVTPMGDLSRMTQFKDKSDNAEFISSALFTYPTLMAADILLHQATLVPVGDDQLQHLELARETVRRFNHRFKKNVFSEPKPRLSRAKRIMGTDGNGKMSKSKNNSISIFDTSEAFWKKLKGAFTDPQRLKMTDPGRPALCNIFAMHEAMSPPATVEEVRSNCEGGKWGCMDCKKVVFDNFETELVPLRKKREEISLADVNAALDEGRDKARGVASKTIRDVRSVMGLGR